MGIYVNYVSYVDFRTGAAEVEPDSRDVALKVSYVSIWDSRINCTDAHKNELKPVQKAKQDAALFQVVGVEKGFGIGRRPVVFWVDVKSSTIAWFQ